MTEHETHHNSAHTPSHEPHQEKKSSSGNNLSIPVAIVVAGFLIAGAILYTDRGSVKADGVNIPARGAVGADSAQATPEDLALRPDDHILGNPSADVLVIEYSDPECPFCKRFHGTMQQIMDTYAKAGNVAWVYRHFPLDQLHPKARKEAEAMECANELGGATTFWKYTNRLYELTPSNNGLDAATLPQIAGELGLDTTKFNVCLSSGKYKDRVDRDFQNGVKVGVSATPTSIIWNKKTNKQSTIAGAYPFENIKTIIGQVVGQ